MSRHWIAGLVWTLLGFALQFVNPDVLNFAELRSLDARQRFRQQPPSPEIVVVAIDQATLEELGHWPFSRNHYIKLIDRLAADGAAVIGLDINFPKPDQKSGLALLQELQKDSRDPALLNKLVQLEKEADTDRALADAVRRAGNVVLGHIFFFLENETAPPFTGAPDRQVFDPAAFGRITQDPPGAATFELARVFPGPRAFALQRNLPALDEAAGGGGHLNLIADPDSIFRRSSLAVEFQRQIYPAFAVQVVRRYRKVESKDLSLIHTPLALSSIGIGDLRVPIDMRGQMLINYRVGPSAYPVLSMSDVIQGKHDDDAVRGKIVLVGATALGIGDTTPTPWGLQPGVQTHAHLIDTMLAQRFIHRGGRERWIDRAILVLFGLGMAFLLAWVRPSRIIPTAGLAAVLLVVFAYWLMAAAGIWISVIVPLVVLVGNSLWVESQSHFRVL